MSKKHTCTLNLQERTQQSITETPPCTACVFPPTFAPSADETHQNSAPNLRLLRIFSDPICTGNQNVLKSIQKSIKDIPKDKMFALRALSIIEHQFLFEIAP